MSALAAQATATTAIAMTAVLISSSVFPARVVRSSARLKVGQGTGGRRLGSRPSL
jgi:hypothetical protein